MLKKKKRQITFFFYLFFLHAISTQNCFQSLFKRFFFFFALTDLEKDWFDKRVAIFFFSMKKKLFCPQVALKLMDTALLKDAYALKNLEREAHMLAAVSHPCIVCLYQTLRVRKREGKTQVKAESLIFSERSVH